MPARSSAASTVDTMSEAVIAGTRALVGIAARSMAEASDDVTLAQQRVLVLLAGAQAQTMGELAEQLGVNPSTATRVCVRLEEKKLVRRRTDSKDRRAVRVQLTPRGDKFIADVLERRRVMIEGVLRRMTPAGRARLADGLAEFAVAAGDLTDGAWTLGWPENPSQEE